MTSILWLDKHNNNKLVAFMRSFVAGTTVPLRLLVHFLRQLHAFFSIWNTLYWDGQRSCRHITVDMRQECVALNASRAWPGDTDCLGGNDHGCKYQQLINDTIFLKEGVTQLLNMLRVKRFVHLVSTMFIIFSKLKGKFVDKLI